MTALITAILQALAAAAPGLLTTIAQSGAKSDEEAIEAARKAARDLPVRTGEGGTWAADLAARKAGGERPEGGLLAIVVNGRDLLAPRWLTYADAVSLAGMTGTPTVTYRRAPGGHGALSPGQIVEVQPGAVIDITHTGGA